jgi:MFS family permease
MGHGLREIFLTRSFLNVFTLMLSSQSLGFAIAYPSPAMLVLKDAMQFSAFEESLFGAITSLTAVCGPFVTSPILNAKGRRFTVQVIAAIFVASWIAMLFTTPGRKYFSHIHRALIGIAAGGVSSVVPMYIMELSPIDLRSIYGAMHQFGISFGIFFINFLGMWFDWYSLAIISLIIAATLTVSVAYVPESPTFHPGGNSRPEPKSQERLCSPQYFRYLMIGIMMMVFQQVSGVNAVLTNLGAILVSRSGPAMAASAQCFAVVCCITFIDKIGRVNAWAVSLFGSAASMLVLAFALRFGWAAAIATGAGFGFFFFFCFGLGPIPWFLPPEFFPDKLRATATPIFSSLPGSSPSRSSSCTRP